MCSSVPPECVCGALIIECSLGCCRGPGRGMSRSGGTECEHSDVTRGGGEVAQHVEQHTERERELELALRERPGRRGRG